MQKLNTLGFAHHVLILGIVMVAVGGVGAMVFKQSKAATTTSAVTIISGTETKCGSYFRNYEVWNVSYTNGLKNSDSVRNLAKQTCEKGFLGTTIAADINKTGNWSVSLQDAIKRFQTTSKGNTNGMPDQVTVCLLGQKSGVDKSSQAAYLLKPMSWSTATCSTILK